MARKHGFSQGHSNADSGISLLPEGIQHLKTFFSKALEKKNEKSPEGMVYVGHKDLDDKLASTLSYLWEHRRDLIKNNDEMFSCYRERLQYLVAIENVIVKACTFIR